MMDETGRSHILTLLLVFTQITGLRSTVPEPCLLNVIPEGTIATMCNASSAVEELISGTLSNDSVVLRIITQQGHCICQLTLLNQTKDETVMLRKQGGSKYAIPIDDTCGLAVDIDHISSGNHTAIDPIQCTKPKGTTAITLAKNGMLQFESRQIDGSFTKGYCMEILRQHNPSSHNLTISITCLEPDRSEETSELPTTMGDNQVSDTSNATPNSTRLIPAQMTKRGLTLYIAIGAGLGALFLLILVVMIIVLKRKKSRQTSATCIRKAEVNTKSCQYQHANKTIKYELRENSLDIPADQYNNTTDNYNTADLENRHIPDGKFNIAADHYNTADIENRHTPDGQFNISADHYNTVDIENRHIPDGQFNIAADHYNTGNIENPHIPEGQYDVVGDHYSHLHLKPHQFSDRIFNNDHYSTLDVEKQQVVDNRFSSKDGYSEIVLGEHASPLNISRDKADANGTTEPEVNVSTNIGSSHYEDIQLPDEEVN